ncbi:CxC2 domain-containing protein [Mycena kentingensis (nom. inval.)]|nr:CxC2 domain-containing protein [Mycena kentingensis (nom. inval.)]
MGRAPKPSRTSTSSFRTGSSAITQHGDLGTHFRASGRGPKTKLVNRAPAVNPYPTPQVQDPLGNWTPMQGGADDGWETDIVEIQIEAPKTKRRRYVSSDDPMRLWRARSQNYLDELLRGDGLGRRFNHPMCAECGADSGRLFRCKECGRSLQCEDCLRDNHRRHPLHRPEVWNGEHWERCTLFRSSTQGVVQLRMTHQVGHHGYPCLRPERLGKGRRRRMVVMDVGGIYEVDIRFCACADSMRHPNGHISQLLDHGWYPATMLEPSTCATFRLLDHFRLLKVVGNANANDFVRVLERATDATLTTKVPERYKSFVRMARQWDFLMRCKRAGQGNLPDGIRTTEPGGLSVWCWACPDPKRNLPAGWENAAAEEAYLYALILALDANFRLKNRIRANERHDPALAQGLGYFVLLEAYKEFLRHYVAEDDVSSCIAFQALMQKETRLTTGLRVSGVGGCVCARHGLVRPLGLGDLQKGERYANMDWILLSAVNGSEVQRLVLSYDIACQWKQRLAARAMALVGQEEERVKGLRELAARVVAEGTTPGASGNTSLDSTGTGVSASASSDVATVDASAQGGAEADAGGGSGARPVVKAIRTDLSKYRVQYALPVWHATAHQDECQAEMSLSHAVGVGRTDGEGIERAWAVLNPISYSTKEMGKGHREDTIEGKIDHMNFMKNVAEDDTLARKYLIALAARDVQIAEFKEVDASLEPWMRRDWRCMVDAWNADRTQPNPYLMKGKHAGLSEAQILADLKKTELEDVRAGRAESMKGKMTSVAFIKAGLQLEEAQRRIAAEVAVTATLTAERASQLDELRVSFWKKLRSWQGQQAVFMPLVTELREEEEANRDGDTPAPLAEATKLWLPSDLSDEQRRGAGIRGLWRLEARLREGQCADALASLRGYLQARSHIIDHRNANVVGQHASTRSNTLIGRIDGQKRRQVLKYQQAHRAGHVLEGDAFAPMFLELRDEDARIGIEVESDAQAWAQLGGVGSTRRVRNEPSSAKRVQPMSWIWKVGGDADTSELHDSVRVQWTKALARRDRWVEEVDLLQEEMRRVLRSLAAVEREWKEREEGRRGADPELVAGARAYAKKQRAIFDGISLRFQRRWSASPAEAVRRVVEDVDQDSDPEDTEDNAGGGIVEVDGDDGEGDTNEGDETDVMDED